MNDYSEKGAAQWIGQLKASSGWEDYSKAEAVYRAYVYDTYLSVSNKDAAALGASGIERCEGKSIAYTPVSYTHLDVYKRQQGLSQILCGTSRRLEKTEKRREKGNVISIAFFIT